MRKILIFGIFFMLFIVLTISSNALNITTISIENRTNYFTTSLDLNFTSNETLTDVVYSINGVNRSVSIVHYQETADASGTMDNPFLFYNGTYGYIGSWSGFEYLTDEQFGPENAFPSNPGGHAEMFINYTKPLNANNYSTWEVGHGDLTTDTKIVLDNVSTAPCWNTYEDKLVFVVASDRSGGGSVKWYCANSTDWKFSVPDTNLSYWVNLSVYRGGLANVFSERMAWNESEIHSNITLTSLSEGIHNLSIYGRESNRTIKQSDYTYFTVGLGIGNCTTYFNPFLNWSFYRSSSVITAADDKINLTFDIIYNTSDYVQYSYDQQSNQVCSAFNNSFIYTGTLLYTGTWTEGYIYNYEFNDETYLGTTLYLNLTVPKLYLNFSNSTDIVVTTTETTYYFEDTSILMAMTNLSVGKVSVAFNNGSQSYEYYNDLNTQIDEDLTVLTNQDDYVNIKVQDESASILDKATTDIWWLDTNTNTTKLVSTIYGNNDKTIRLKGTDIYRVNSYLSGYTQTNGFDIMKPEELEGNTKVITMSQNGSIVRVNIWANRDRNLPFVNDLPISYPLIVYVKADDEMQDAEITWYTDDVLFGLPHIMTGDQHEFSSSINFLNSYTNMTALVYVKDADNNEIEQSFLFRNTVRYKRYDVSFYSQLLYSKFAFAIFLVFTLSIGMGIQKKFRRYGIESVVALSVMLSFLNLYMIIPSVILGFAKIMKKTVSDDI